MFKRPVQIIRENLTPRRVRDERIFLCPQDTSFRIVKKGHNVCTGLGVSLSPSPALIKKVKRAIKREIEKNKEVSHL